MGQQEVSFFLNMNLHPCNLSLSLSLSLSLLLWRVGIPMTWDEGCLLQKTECCSFCSWCPSWLKGKELNWQNSEAASGKFDSILDTFEIPTKYPCRGLRTPHRFWWKLNKTRNPYISWAPYHGWIASFPFQTPKKGSKKGNATTTVGGIKSLNFLNMYIRTFVF